MHIDIMTAMLALITLLALLGCQLVFFWTQDRRSRWLAWLIVPFILGAGGVALLVLRWRAGDFLAIGVAYVLVISAFGILWQGVRVFERRAPRMLPVLASAALWFGLCLWPAFTSSQPLRVAVLSALIALYCGLAAGELWRGRMEKLPSRIPAVVVLASYTAFMLIRIALVGVAPYPVGGLPIEAGWIGAFNVVVFVHVAAFAILMVSLTKERRESEQRNYALTDPLTGLFNRRAFAAQSQRIAYRRKFGREQTSLLVLDLDHFKRVNDRFGHDTGDQVLVAFAAVAEAALRPSDSLYRIGGEEFCFVLPDTALADAITLAERIRLDFEVVSVDADGERVRATVSIGIATTDFSGFDLEVLLAAADAALYEAKARGRNRVVVAEPTAIRRLPGPQTAPRLRA